MSLKLKIITITFLIAVSPVFAFDDGFLFGLKANFLGSYTDTHISKADLANMGGATYMSGLVGFVMSGEAELTYLFDSKKYFKMKTNDVFGGLGLAFNIGVGQGYSGQASGSLVGATQIDVFFTARYMPMATFGTSVKAYFLKNRIALGFGIGAKLIADPNPTYYFYSSEPSVFEQEVGTLIISKEMMKKMNPLMFTLKLTLEYNQPVLPTTELVLGLHISYSIYKPGYLTMPPKLLTAATAQGFDQNKKVSSFFMNSFDFGLMLGLVFKG